MSAAVPDEKAPNVVADSSCSSTAYTTPDNERQEAPGDEPEAPSRDISGWKWWLVMASILSSIFFYALDNTVVADIQPVIIGDLGELEKLTWLSVAFLLGATATNLIWGKVYSQFNAKWTYILNVAVSEIGSAVCEAAPSKNVMIVRRALCGVAGAGLYVGVMTLIAMTTSLPERPLYVGGTGLTWGIGIVLGPVVGGGFGESSVGWRWAFYINLLIGALCAPVYLFLLPSKDPRPGVALKERSREMDIVGAALQMAALTTFVLAISWGGVAYPWNSGQVIGLFVASGVLFVVLGLQQVFLVFTTIERRIIPVQFFGSRTVLVLFASTAAAGASAFVPIYMIPLYFQFTRGDAALDAGVRLLPFIILMVATILTNGALLSKFGYYMPWYTAGGLLSLTGGALMYTVDLNTSTSRIYGYTVILGLGVGLWIQASFAVAQAVVEPKYVPAAVGFITLAQFAGITIVMAIANTIFLNECLTSIPRILPNVPREEIEAAIQGTSDLLDRLSSDVRSRVLEAIVSGISKSYALVIAAGALVALLSLLMKHERLFNVSAAVGAA
ncbi:putative HC-toxin efflux carrier TOXA [Aspergillus udagawae]|uniref:HC-toxin efflux carrier TOXA n=1 Tax=Aspergillus udagawae TaxID=91492 RepID=A0ABQ1B8N8_9EURO|nr:putative HC-toxin efflux carrier TOXA [Aspergillus udagawae]